MGLETVWCLGCKNASKSIPSDLISLASQLNKEYKYIIYCVKQNCLVVANDNMFIDKTKECPLFER
jgi:hypothetical protein